MTPELKQFIQNNKDLINQNTKESWEEIYDKLPNSKLKGEFTKTILDAGINDPATIIESIPQCYLCKSNIENYVISDNITYIGWNSFQYCSMLSNVVIGNNVTTIGNSAFSECERLTSIVIPDSVTVIESYAFGGSGLTSAVLGNNVKEIGFRAFYCSKLSSITISDSVTSIHQQAFYWCKSLTQISYKGTKKSWRAITKHSEWRYQSNIEQIVCTDGVIEL